MMEVPPYYDERGKVFIGGLSRSTTKETLLRYFSKYGQIIDCVVIVNQQTGLSRGFGFVTYKDPSCVELVLADIPHVLDGRLIDPKVCNPISMNQGSKHLQNIKRKVFVGGLPSDCTDDLLKEVFSQYGEVVDTMIIYDQLENRSRGFGFVTFKQEETVDSLVLQHYVKIGDKQVECKRAEPQNTKDLESPTSCSQQLDVFSGYISASKQVSSTGTTPSPNINVGPVGPSLQLSQVFQAQPTVFQQQVPGSFHSLKTIFVQPGGGFGASATYYQAVPPSLCGPGCYIPEQLPSQVEVPAYIPLPDQLPPQYEGQLFGNYQHEPSSCGPTRDYLLEQQQHQLLQQPPQHYSSHHPPPSPHHLPPPTHLINSSPSVPMSPTLPSSPALRGIPPHFRTPNSPQSPPPGMYNNNLANSGGGFGSPFQGGNSQPLLQPAYLPAGLPPSPASYSRLSAHSSLPSFHPYKRP